MHKVLPHLTPRRMLAASIAVAALTIALKTLAWWLTDSVGLLSDAMESFVNLASAMFALRMVTVAQAPPDEEHPYGHHKAEYFSSGFEGILIVGAALGIIWAAVHRIADPQPLARLDWGLGLSVASSVLNGLLAWVMHRAARAHRSIALEADARHLVTDVWTSAGVVAGLALAGATGWLWLDAAVAIGVAVNILREGVWLVWRSSHGLMDQALEPLQQADIQRTLDGLRGPGVHFDHVSTRRAGQRSFVDLHMHVPGDWTMARAAARRLEVERALMQAVPGLRASIQLLADGWETAAAGEGD